MVSSFKTLCLETWALYRRILLYILIGVSGKGAVTAAVSQGLLEGAIVTALLNGFELLILFAAFFEYVRQTGLKSEIGAKSVVLFFVRASGLYLILYLFTHGVISTSLDFAMLQWRLDRSIDEFLPNISVGTIYYIVLIGSDWLAMLLLVGLIGTWLPATLVDEQTSLLQAFRRGKERFGAVVGKLVICAVLVQALVHITVIVPGLVVGSSIGRAIETPIFGPVDIVAITVSLFVAWCTVAFQVIFAAVVLTRSFKEAEQARSNADADVELSSNQEPHLLKC